MRRVRCRERLIVRGQPAGKALSARAIRDRQQRWIHLSVASVHADCTLVRRMRLIDRHGVGRRERLVPLRCTGAEWWRHRWPDRRVNFGDKLCQIAE